MAARRYEAKTTANDGDVTAFLESVPHPVRRRDARVLRALFERVTGEPAVMWGGAIVGFGHHHFAYPSGHSGDVAAAGFAPRTTSSTVYFMNGFEDYADDLARLGPHTLGKSCLYLKNLDHIDLEVLAGMILHSYETLADEAPGLDQAAVVDEAARTD